MPGPGDPTVNKVQSSALMEYMVYWWVRQTLDKLIPIIYLKRAINPLKERYRVLRVTGRTSFRASGQRCLRR